MSTVVTLPPIVGGPSIVIEELLPYREDPAAIVSFRGVRQITEAGIREVVSTGTNVATRPLYLLDASLAVFEAVAQYLDAEPRFTPYVHWGDPVDPADPSSRDRDVPPPPEPEQEPRFAHAWTDREWRVTAAALEADTRDPLTAVLAGRLRASMVPPSDIGTGVGWPR